jgi:CRP/FNR family nitrogen fixation transcriptional regulator
MLVEEIAVGSRPTPVKLVSVAPGLALPGVSMNFDANEEIFGEDRTADFVYAVVSGAVRTTRLLSDGRRQIAGFHLPGDVFGFERGRRRRFSAAAITPSEIAVVRRSAVEFAAERDGEAARQLWALACRELEILQEHVLLLGHRNAADRVEGFLRQLAQRRSSAIVDLPMSRSDIGDYLGLTLETVSRTLSQFARVKIIAMPSARRVVLCEAVAA